MLTNPRSERRSRTAATVVLTALTAAALPGCGTVKSSATPRTATEQMLLTNAWDAALGKVDFRPLAGVPVYLDTSNVSAIDQGWVVSSIKQAMLTQGVLLRQKPEQAQWVVEARVGAYGTDEDSWLLGIQQTTVPPLVTGVPSGTIPEIPLIKRSRQSGVAKLALFGYDRNSGQLVWNSGTMLAVANSKDVHFLGVGPIHSGPIQQNPEFVGIKLPLPADGDPSDPTAVKTRESLPFSAPNLQPQTPSATRDGFAP